VSYKADGDIADLFKPATVERTARRIVKRTGDFMLERVESHTPIAKVPPGVDIGEWLMARGGRAPRHLRDSWRVTDVMVTGQWLTGEDVSGLRIELWTDDPVAPHVEYPTRPHLIVPHDPDGWLRWWDEHGGIHFAKVVHHPGTQGSFMMAKTIAETDVEWDVIGREEVTRWADSYWT
jgi:hypothetical protein